MKAFAKPEAIVQESGYCGGCGHGVVQRLIAECLEELAVEDKAINVVDIACCFWALDGLDYDGIAGPHGRCAAVATAMKRVRPDSVIFVHAGDGASYSIGWSETTYAAIRDVPITMLVVNNGIFGMTGGQMSPGTTPLGQKTTSSPFGRDAATRGKPGDFLKVLSGFDFEYAARGALYSVPEVNRTKKFIKKAFENQLSKRGFSIVEILSPCPTNWGLTPLDSNRKIEEEITKFYPIGEVVDRGGKK